VLRAEAATVVDYHDADWTAQILDATAGPWSRCGCERRPRRWRERDGDGRDGGRLATITSDPSEPERGIGIASVYVRPDAHQLELAADALAAGRLLFGQGASFPLAQAEAALTRAIAGRGGAVVLEL
jgi:hypothetical protein